MTPIQIVKEEIARCAAETLAAPWASPLHTRHGFSEQVALRCMARWEEEFLTQLRSVLFADGYIEVGEALLEIRCVGAAPTNHEFVRGILETLRQKEKP